MKQNIAQGVVDHFPQAMWDYEIRTPEQVAHFISQCCHESDHFRTVKEYADGSAYEGRRDLGNTQAGDGKRFRGRGYIQVTGRANYTAMAEELGVDLVNQPTLLETDLELAAYASTAWWYKNNVNNIINQGGTVNDVAKKVTKRVNGGYNHLKERQEKTRRAFQKIDEIMDGIFDNVDKSETT